MRWRDLGPGAAVEPMVPPLLLAAWVLSAAGLRLRLLAEQAAAVGSGGWAGLLGITAFPGILVFHLTAELCMAIVPALGAVAWWRGRRWGAAVLVFGIGLQIYAVANATAWAVANHVPTLVVLQLNLAVDLAVALPLAWRPARAARPRRFTRPLIAAVFVLLALQIVGLWTMFFVTGQVGDVTAFQVDVGVPIFRELGEAAILILGLAGAWGWVRRRPWGAGVALLALGMLAYAAVNTMSHAVLTSAPRMVFHGATVGVVVGLLRPALRAYYSGVP